MPDQMPDASADETLPVVCHENVWIDLPDGVRLAARIWLPQGAEAVPVPAILEYLPYRKRDGTVARDALTHPYFAARGYACVRVDIRGNGDSDGLMSDEYSEQELSDAEAVIAWLRRQPWCDGAVGMMGISWGGFNALQTAARRPAGLAAVVTLCSTDDRFADDIHYSGGCLLNENLGWGATMLSYSSRPPDPDLVGERWRHLWLDRLANQPLLIDRWLRHQTRDDYWRHGSVCEDIGAIEAAVLAVGGWGDAYSNAVPRLLATLKSPRKGIIGPWVHKYPHFAVPGPRIGFLQEALRWWDRWLKGRETGVEQDPDLRVYQMESARPATWYTERAGTWLGVPVWPPADPAETHFEVRGGTLRAQDQAETPHGSSMDDATRCGERVIHHRTPQTCGLDGGEYCAIWLGPDWPGDQRADDARALVFETEPLRQPLDILGAARLELAAAFDQPFALLAVRLVDVHPDGAATRITHDVLNVRHRDDPANPSAVPVGEPLPLTLSFDDVGYRIPAGHRLRLSLSTAYWPLIWPSPALVTLSLDPATMRLVVPGIPAGVDRTIADHLPPPQSAPEHPTRIIREGAHKRMLEVDQATGAATIHILDDFGREENLETGIIVEEIARETQVIQPDDPLCASMSAHWTQVRTRGDWHTRTEAHARMTADRHAFTIEAQVDAYEGTEKIHTKTWRETVPRDHV